MISGSTLVSCHVLRTGHTQIYIYSFFPALRAPSFIHKHTNIHPFPPPQLVQAVTYLVPPDTSLISCVIYHMQRNCTNDEHPWMEVTKVTYLMTLGHHEYLLLNYTE
ncbi:uncharacterized protein K444DRAFT_307323 [Hyaloscypha bicolor E]|uniref:Uncharacterized protein n=1 Tax=Hyaloscypha bicolor E TaxID=1095630 RepID=A0A2J6TMG5_9HELO|nr:uncharacterized protein K444DRAFT_307323 [Hyaloscypha bicolor E]PMD64210.1 hypothetical protein K444DRAFT_307323 [Hyaloscypha bicolor E]